MNNLNSPNSEKTMNSLEIAELTGKRHDNVCADIRKMCEKLEIEATEFLVAYKMPSGQNATVYNLHKRECDILVSGYEIKYRAAIIDRWIELENQENLTPLEVQILHLQKTVALEKANAETQRRIKTIEDKQKLQDGSTGYMSVLAYCRFKNIKMSLSESNSTGRKCAKYCKDEGINIGKVPDERWGKVGSYPVEVINEILEGLNE